MPAPSTTIIEAARLNLRFSLNRNYTINNLLLELQDYVNATDKRIEQLENIIADQEARLTAGGL